MPPKTILIADDEQHLALLEQKRLNLAGYQTHIAYDGKTCLELINTHKPDLVLLDVDLPLINGSDVLNTLQKNPTTKNLPVIFLTGLTEKDTEQDTSYGTRQLFMSKPVDFEKLLVEIKKRIG